MYDESEGKMLLLAVVEHCDPSAFSAFNHRARRNSGSRHGRYRWRGAGSAGGRGRGLGWGRGGTEAGTGTGTGGGRRQGAAAAAVAAAAVAPEANVQVEFFPGDDFRFTIDCHLLVLAENQTNAEDMMFNFQARAFMRAHSCVIDVRRKRRACVCAFMRAFIAKPAVASIHLYEFMLICLSPFCFYFVVLSFLCTPTPFRPYSSVRDSRITPGAPHTPDSRASPH